MEEVQQNGLDLLWFPHFLDEEEATTLHHRIYDETPWEQSTINMFGKDLLEPRLSAWCGEPDAVYKYSGRIHVPHPWTPLLLQLKEQLEATCETHFNSVLINHYRDGKDSMGYHADDEPELGPHPTIASLSLGGERRFLFRHRHDKSLATVKYNLTHGSLLVMRGTTQRDWKHGIPKTKRAVRPRTNLTFRMIGPSYDGAP